MKTELKYFIATILLVTFLSVGYVFAQINYFYPNSDDRLQPVDDSWGLYTAQDLDFDGEILPDGSACSNGEILKRIGADNWDCVVDDDLPDANEIVESMLKAVDSAGDEECLTYESTVGDFEWQVCSAGAGDVTGVGDCATGACFDGTSDGGTYFDFYDAQGFSRLIGGDNSSSITITLPTATGTLIYDGGAFHDNFSDFVANEHLDWTGNVGTIDTGNYIEGHGDGANCNAGEYALGVDAAGAVESCTDATTEINTVVATKDECSEITNCVANAWDGLTDMVLTDNYIYVGDAYSNPGGVAMSNDCTIISDGTITCDHDALDNFVANEHIDWTASSAGTIHATNYVDGDTQLTEEQVEELKELVESMRARTK